MFRSAQHYASCSTVSLQRPCLAVCCCLLAIVNPSPCWHLSSPLSWWWLCSYLVFATPDSGSLAELLVSWHGCQASGPPPPNSNQLIMLSKDPTLDIQQPKMEVYCLPQKENRIRYPNQVWLPCIWILLRVTVKSLARIGLAGPGLGRPGCLTTWSK